MEETMLGYKVITNQEYEMIISGEKKLNKIADGKFYESIKDAISNFETGRWPFEYYGETYSKIVVRLKATGNIKRNSNNGYSFFTADKMTNMSIVPIDKLVSEYLKSKSDDILSIIFGYEDFTMDLLKNILNNTEFLENIDVIKEQIINKNPIFNSEILEIIIQKKIKNDVDKKCLFYEIACSPFVNLKILNYLIQNCPYDNIIWGIMKNPNTPCEVIKTIINNEKIEIKKRRYINDILNNFSEYLKSNIEILEFVLENYYKDDYSYDILNIITKLSDKDKVMKIVEIIIRKTNRDYILKMILEIPDLDKNILKLILKKINPSNEEEIKSLKNDFFDSAEGIKVLLETNLSPSILKWAAKNPNSDEEIFKKILENTNDEEILVEIARNNSANENILKLILNRTDEYYIFQAMIKNPHITQELLIIIFNEVDYYEFEVLISNLDFSYSDILSLLLKMKVNFFNFNNAEYFKKLLFIEKQIIKFRIELQGKSDLGYDYKVKYVKFLSLFLNIKNSEIKLLIDSEVKELEEIGESIFETDSSITINSDSETYEEIELNEEVTPRQIFAMGVLDDFNDAIKNNADGLLTSFGHGYEKYFSSKKKGFIRRLFKK